MANNDRRDGIDGLCLFQQPCTKISTGIPQLDDLFGGGGIRSRELVEIVGEPGSGKTQLCHQLAIMAARFPKSSVAYIDTCNSFSAKRLFQMSQHLSKEDVYMPLHRIRCFRIFDADSLVDCLKSLVSDLSAISFNRNRRNENVENVENINIEHVGNVNLEKDKSEFHFLQTLRLVIIDSVAAVMLPLLNGYKTPTAAATLEKIGTYARHLAIEYNIAVVLTNFVVNDREKHIQIFGKPLENSQLCPHSLFATKPALGRSWTFVPNLQIILANVRKWSKWKDSSHEQSPPRVACIGKSARSAIGKHVLF